MSLVGQTIGNYKVVQQLGEGGMGVVYLAEHPVIGRRVAIKLLHATFAKDSETVARFFNEARAIHMIGHHNIVEILDFGQTTDGQPYFIMEFLSGESLAELISRGPLAPTEAVGIVSQICDALQAAHDKKIVHRDLKPHNVYLAGEEHPPMVKILDFGVAKMAIGWDTAQSGGHSVKTRTGSLMGTPLYMSPEQCRGSGKLDHRTDIYSLAVILFEMISGRPPFIAEGVGELFAKHMLEPAPSLAEFAPHTPPHIVRAVERALSKNLEDRFPTMRAMRDALNGKPDAAGAGPETSATPTAARPTAIPAQTFSRLSPSDTASLRPAEQSTTLSSAVSEVGNDVDPLPTRSRRAVVLGVMALAALAAVAFGVMRKGGGGPQASVVAATSPPAAPAPAPAPPPPAAPAEPETVSVQFDAEPASTHVFRKVAGHAGPGEDLGGVPLNLKLPRHADTTDFVLRAEGFKDRPVSIDLERDQVLHLGLEALPAVAAVPKDKDKDKKKIADKRPAAKPARRPVTHDADGLAVPSF